MSGTAQITVTVTVGTEPVKQAVAELADLLARLVNRFPELRERLFAFTDRVGELFEAENDRLGTPSGHEIRLRLKPSDALLAFMATAWVATDRAVIEAALDRIFSPEPSA